MPARHIVANPKHALLSPQEAKEQAHALLIKSHQLLAGVARIAQEAQKCLALAHELGAHCTEEHRRCHDAIPRQRTAYRDLF